MSDSIHYKYRPLRYPDAIRLCRLLPHSNTTSSINISLSSYRLSNPDLKFTALSYTWGDPSDKLQICVGDRTAFLQVPRSAGEALTILRLHGKRKLFWIDAICIDQSNLQEKTSQVRIMGRIFARAFATVIYLGPHTESSQIVFQEVTEAQNAPKVNDQWRHKMLLDRDPPNSAVVQGLEELIQRPWFQRVWVLQEVFLSRSIWVLCGDSMVPKELLLACFFGYAESTRVIQRNVPFALRVDTGLMDISFHPSWYNLWECLYRTRNSLATDSRDKLFALRALFVPPEANDTDLFMTEFDKMINYENSFEEILTKLALVFIQFVGLGLILGVRHGHDRQMPSWVPDWSQNLPLGMRHFMFSPFLEQFDDSVDRVTPRKYQILDPLILSVRGGRYGQIQEMGKEFLFAGFEDAESQISYLVRNVIANDPSGATQMVDSRMIEAGLTFNILRVLRQIRLDQFANLISRGVLRPKHLPDINEEEMESIMEALQGCRFVLYGPSFIAIAPRSAMEGDILVMIEGAYMPCLIRPASEGTWTLVSGDCYTFPPYPLLPFDPGRLRNGFGQQEEFLLS